MTVKEHVQLFEVIPLFKNPNLDKMLPETTFDILNSENATTPRSEPMDVDGDYLEPFHPKKATSSIIDTFSLTMLTSSYLHRIPSGSRQWENYLEDLVDSKCKRSRRMTSEKESITDFLNRFPVYEVWWESRKNVHSSFSPLNMILIVILKKIRI